MDLDVVLRSIEAWNAQDLEGFMDCFSADAVVVSDERFPGGGTFEGRDAARGFFTDAREVWEGGSRVDFHEFREVGGHVLGEFTWSATGGASGAETKIETTLLWTIRDGLIARAEFFIERDDALKAATRA
jgi:ketosteroid isomerase-like protein